MTDLLGNRVNRRQSLQRLARDFVEALNQGRRRRPVEPNQGRIHEMRVSPAPAPTHPRLVFPLSHLRHPPSPPLRQTSQLRPFSRYLLSKPQDFSRMPPILQDSGMPLLNLPEMHYHFYQSYILFNVSLMECLTVLPSRPVSSTSPVVLTAQLCTGQ